FMQAGKRLAAPEPLEESRHRAAAELALLPEHLKQLETAQKPYTVEIAPVLRQLAESVDRTAH
ncbi:MAG: nicotinate phosphoribosyltransferase, partial [Sulfuricella sp.]